MVDLGDHIALVTGAGGGIGSAIATRFAAAGGRVVAVDADVSRVASCSGVHPIEGDVTSEPAVAQALAFAQDELGGLTDVVNTVGISGRSLGDGPIHEIPDGAWDTVMRVNLRSVFVVCRAAVPLLLGGGGSITNISSVLALRADRDFATHAYAASKGAIVSLTRAMAIAYAAEGIRCNAICPGLIDTQMSRRVQDDPGIRARLAELQPLTGELGAPADIAAAAAFLASDEARFLTGVVLPVDGGWTAR